MAGFFDLAEKFYYDKSAITSDRSAIGTALIWSWTEIGLRYKVVPPAIYNEVMALRACEYALQLDPARSDAVSLWLASAYKREVELPEGGVDPTWDDKQPNTHYYAVASGVGHLQATLGRALRDGNAAVALKAVTSLQEIAGASSLLAGDGEKPILDALRFPSRQVRFEAAFAVAQAIPKSDFVGKERVVQILAEALGQTGKDEANRFKQVLSKNAGYVIGGGESLESAVASAAGLPGVEVIVVSENHPGLERLFTLARENVRLERSAVLVLSASEFASPYASLANTNPLITVASKDADLPAAVENARKRAGGLVIDDKVAAAYALRSADLLERLATVQGHSLDLSLAQTALLAGLDAGSALAQLGSKEAQIGIAVKALDAKSPDDLKLPLLKNLSTSARKSGNHLDKSQVDALTAYVQSAPSLELRAAAAEAHGALNLAADRVKTLIFNRPRN
jgi:hypothetical protein